ncbi:MAG: 16S rRNA (guanine(527)-N(7))-methyltransferase RsmG [Spirochaetaceae bacterium]|nr:MAG: 16S rRNA (guanine(527)-N(7))-methyltransferase RsmG [Spirochaetaceae bacterium]
MGPAGGVDRTGRRRPVLSESDRALLRDGLAAVDAARGGRESSSRITAAGNAADSAVSPVTSAVLCAALERYLEELLLWSRRTNLVKFDLPRDLIVRHVLDSLAAAPIIEQLLAEDGPQRGRSRVCDVGSGAGFPGIPLALYLPLGEVVLLERSAARAAFLRTVCALLDRPGLSVSQTDLAAVDQTFDVLLVRALSPFDDRAVGQLARILAAGGALLVYQGREAKTAATAERLSRVFEDVRTVPVNVPLLKAQRHVIVARQPRGVRTSC